MISTLLLLFALHKNEDKLVKYIYSIASWMLICFGITEALSVFSAISMVNLWVCWLTTSLLLVICNIIRYRRLNIKSIMQSIKEVRIRKNMFFWGFFALFMLALAVKTVPYNYDSMTYHLMRLFHWMQNGSVDYYATSVDRQVASPIGAAYVNLHVYVMTGGSDRWVNLLQCFSYLTNGVLVYFITKKIGCSRKYCNMAMVLLYTMPIAVAEALTTQVDNFSTVWMLSIVYLLLDLLDKEKKMQLDMETSVRVFMLSLCVGFGYLTKPSIGVGLLFFAIWLLVVAVRRKDSLRTIAIYLLIAGIVLGILLIPGFYRNIVTFGALSAPNVGQRQLVGTLNPIRVFVNWLKNFTFNMPTIWLYDSGTIIYSFVMGVAALLRVDINNPAISEDGIEFLVYNAQKYSHDRAVNPVIVYMLIACIIFWFMKNRKNHKGEFRNCYFIVAALAFLIFCAILRWEPFVSRYMISYMAVLCPGLVAQLELVSGSEGNGKWKYLGIGMYVIVYFVSIAEITGLVTYHTDIAINSSRHSGYFRNNPYVEESYRTIAEYVNGRDYKNIGLLLDGNGYEYPLTMMLDTYARMEHVNVINATGKYEDETFIPDIIISMDREGTEGSIICHGIEYQIVERIEENICLLEPIDTKR